MVCKNCGLTVKDRQGMLADFCSETCFWSYEGDPITEIKSVQFIEEKEVTASVNIQIHWNCIKRKTKPDNGIYFISKKTLEPYLGMKSFGKFLKENKLMVVNWDSEMSVIKRSIL